MSQPAPVFKGLKWKWLQNYEKEIADKKSRETAATPSLSSASSSQQEQSPRRQQDLQQAGSASRNVVKPSEVSDPSPHPNNIVRRSEAVPGARAGISSNNVLSGPSTSSNEAPPRKGHGAATAPTVPSTATRASGDPSGKKAAAPTAPTTHQPPLPGKGPPSVSAPTSSGSGSNSAHIPTTANSIAAATAAAAAAAGTSNSNSTLPAAVQAAESDAARGSLFPEGRVKREKSEKRESGNGDGNESGRDGVEKGAAVVVEKLGQAAQLAPRLGQKVEDELQGRSSSASSSSPAPASVSLALREGNPHVAQQPEQQRQGLKHEGGVGSMGEQGPIAATANELRPAEEQAVAPLAEKRGETVGGPPNQTPLQTRGVVVPVSSEAEPPQGGRRQDEGAAPPAKAAAVSQVKGVTSRFMWNVSLSRTAADVDLDDDLFTPLSVLPTAAATAPPAATGDGRKPSIALVPPKGGRPPSFKKVPSSAVAPKVTSAAAAREGGGAQRSFQNASPAPSAQSESAVDDVAASRYVAPNSGKRARAVSSGVRDAAATAVVAAADTQGNGNGNGNNTMVVAGLGSSPNLRPATAVGSSARRSTSPTAQDLASSSVSLPSSVVKAASLEVRQPQRRQERETETDRDPRGSGATTVAGATATRPVEEEASLDVEEEEAEAEEEEDDFACPATQSSGVVQKPMDVTACGTAKDGERGARDGGKSPGLLSASESSRRPPLRAAGAAAALPKEEESTRGKAKTDVFADGGEAGTAGERRGRKTQDNINKRRSVSSQAPPAAKEAAKESYAKEKDMETRTEVTTKANSTPTHPLLLYHPSQLQQQQQQQQEQKQRPDEEIDAATALLLASFACAESLADRIKRGRRSVQSLGVGAHTPPVASAAAAAAVGSRGGGLGGVKVVPSSSPPLTLTLTSSPSPALAEEGSLGKAPTRADLKTTPRGTTHTPPQSVVVKGDDDEGEGEEEEAEEEIDDQVSLFDDGPSTKKAGAGPFYMSSEHKRKGGNKEEGNFRGVVPPPLSLLSAGKKKTPKSELVDSPSTINGAFSLGVGPIVRGAAAGADRVAEQHRKRALPVTAAQHLSSRRRVAMLEDEGEKEEEEGEGGGHPRKPRTLALASSRAATRLGRAGAAHIGAAPSVMAEVPTSSQTESSSSASGKAVGSSARGAAAALPDDPLSQPSRASPGKPAEGNGEQREGEQQVAKGKEKEEKRSSQRKEGSQGFHDSAKALATVESGASVCFKQEDKDKGGLGFPKDPRRSLGETGGVKGLPPLSLSPANGGGGAILSSEGAATAHPPSHAKSSSHRGSSARELLSLFGSDSFNFFATSTRSRSTRGADRSAPPPPPSPSVAGGASGTGKGSDPAPGSVHDDGEQREQTSRGLPLKRRRGEATEPLESGNPVARPVLDPHGGKSEEKEGRRETRRKARSDGGSLHEDKEGEAEVSTIELSGGVASGQSDSESIRDPLLNELNTKNRKKRRSSAGEGRKGPVWKEAAFQSISRRSPSPCPPPPPPPAFSAVHRIDNESSGVQRGEAVAAVGVANAAKMGGKAEERDLDTDNVQGTLQIQVASSRIAGSGSDLSSAVRSRDVVVTTSGCKRTTSVTSPSPPKPPAQRRRFAAGQMLASASVTAAAEAESERARGEYAAGEAGGPLAQRVSSCPERPSDLSNLHPLLDFGVICHGETHGIQPTFSTSANRKDYSHKGGAAAQRDTYTSRGGKASAGSKEAPGTGVMAEGLREVTGEHAGATAAPADVAMAASASSPTDELDLDLDPRTGSSKRGLDRSADPDPDPGTTILPFGVPTGLTSAVDSAADTGGGSNDGPAAPRFIPCVLDVALPAHRLLQKHKFLWFAGESAGSAKGSQPGSSPSSHRLPVQARGNLVGIHGSGAPSTSGAGEAGDGSAGIGSGSGSGSDGNRTVIALARSSSGSDGETVPRPQVRSFNSTLGRRSPVESAAAGGGGKTAGGERERDKTEQAGAQARSARKGSGSDRDDVHLLAPSAAPSPSRKAVPSTAGAMFLNSGSGSGKHGGAGRGAVREADGDVAGGGASGIREGTRGDNEKGKGDGMSSAATRSTCVVRPVQVRTVSDATAAAQGNAEKGSAAAAGAAALKMMSAAAAAAAAAAGPESGLEVYVSIGDLWSYKDLWQVLERAFNERIQLCCSAAATADEKTDLDSGALSAMASTRGGDGGPLITHSACGAGGAVSDPMTSMRPFFVSRDAHRLVYLDSEGDWLLCSPDEPWRCFAEEATKLLVIDRL